MELPYGPQVLWPDHCVWDTHGAAVLARSRAAACPAGHPQGLPRGRRFLFRLPGSRPQDQDRPRGLSGERDFKRLFIAGLATDFCVDWTAVDAANAGFETYVIEDASRAIDTGGSLAQAWADMTEAGVKRIVAGDIA